MFSLTKAILFRVQAQVEVLLVKLQMGRDGALEATARVSELVEYLERAEHSSVHTRQMASKSMAELDSSLASLQKEVARLEAELKREKQRADELQRDLHDAQKDNCLIDSKVKEEWGVGAALFNEILKK